VIYTTGAIQIWFTLCWSDRA